MYRVLIWLALCVAAGNGLLLAAEKPENRALAEYYAPVVYQESKSAILDYITRFDYDGDWNGSNNWRNAYRYELRAYVYYGVVESTNHVFITYAFYHPRDFTARPLEGMARGRHQQIVIGIGEAVARLPLPHHRAYGSVHGGSIGYASSLRLVKEGQAI